ncbi:MAG TPA: ABC transporter ATP-binding protein/permease [Candidatus Tetragenococcus pullicola]|nr:ABC transporter ATP-binding protein/permease [Candidatus Tetragenococcus pullicola]
MLKKLLHELKEFKIPSILASSFMVGEVILELLLPYLMSFIVDRGVYQKDLGAVVKYGIYMLIAAFFSLVFGALSGNYAAYASSGFVRNLREAMFRNIQTFSFANIDKFATSGLVTRMMTDATNVQNAYQMVIRLCVRAPLMLIVATFMTFYINSNLALIFLGAIVFLGIALTIITMRSYPQFRRAFKQYDNLNGSVQENINNIRIVKAYVKEKTETEKFQRAVQNLRKMFTKAETTLVWNNPIMQLTMYACMIALSWFGAHFVVSNSMTTGELMSMFTYTMNILISLMMLAMIFVMLSMSFASGQRIVEVLEEEPAIVNPENPVEEIRDGTIAFNDVSFGYYKDHKKNVLHDINLTIKSGETVGILGPTGSSKTTLVNLIPRLYDVSKGSVQVGGLDVRNYDLTALRDNVSVVLQKNVLFSGTIIENMRWGNEQATLEEIKEACHLARADEFIETMTDQYDSWVEQGGSNFSGGQKQRLCIARALLKKPKILILDDSTSAVDTKTDSQIRKALKTSLPKTTKLIISQRITSIEDADRIIVMDEGYITGNGTHDQLLKENELYQQIYDTQKKGDQ